MSEPSQKPLTEEQQRIECLLKDLKPLKPYDKRRPNNPPSPENSLRELWKQRPGESDWDYRQRMNLYKQSADVKTNDPCAKYKKLDEQKEPNSQNVPIASSFVKSEGHSV